MQFDGIPCKQEQITMQATMEQHNLREGAEYRYSCPYPVGCKGHLYRILKFIKDIPSYQQKVLVEALSGPDAGMWFTCSVANFITRYQAVEETSLADSAS